MAAATAGFNVAAKGFSFAAATVLKTGGVAFAAVSEVKLIAFAVRVEFVVVGGVAVAAVKVGARFNPAAELSNSALVSIMQQHWMGY